MYQVSCPFIHFSLVVVDVGIDEDLCCMRWNVVEYAVVIQEASFVVGGLVVCLTSVIIGGHVLNGACPPSRTPNSRVRDAPPWYR